MYSASNLKDIKASFSEVITIRGLHIGVCKLGSISTLLCIIPHFFPDRNDINIVSEEYVLPSSVTNLSKYCVESIGCTKGLLINRKQQKQHL